MLYLYLYDSATGRVLATAAYNEVGDGAAARTLANGQIDPATEYAPAGVKTARPTFNPALVLDKQSIVANATDAATVTGIPAGTVAKVFKDGEQLPRGAATINDGSLVLRADTAGVYRILFTNFPTRQMTFQVAAT